MRVAASGTDDHVVFLEHPDLPEALARLQRAALPRPDPVTDDEAATASRRRISSSSVSAQLGDVHGLLDRGRRRDVDLAGEHVDALDRGLLGQQLRRLLLEAGGDLAERCASRASS